VEKRLVTEFVTPGALRLYFRDFAVTEEEKQAAAAARCAASQGLFWEYREAHATGNTLSLDEASFEACTAEREVQGAIESDTEAGRNAGVQAIPTLFVNGERIAGVQPYEVFRESVERALFESSELP
jgi:protein-disulfide isomerase